MSVPWPTHRAKNRAAKQLDNWRKKQARKQKRLSRKQQGALDAARPVWDEL